MEVHLGSVMLLSICAAFETSVGLATGIYPLVTPDCEVKTSVFLFYRTEQSLELQPDSETNPRRGHAVHSGVGNCVPASVTLRNGSILHIVKLRDSTILYMVQYTVGLP